MDLRQLRYFVAIAEARSFTTAAKSLLVTQPTLTMAMKKLETDLGTKLFHQSDTGHRPTDTGQLLYDEGKPVLESFLALEERVKHWGDGRREQLRVGLTVLFSLQLMQRIATFMATHGNVEVTLVQDGSREMQRRLVAGEVDLGILSFPKYEPGVELEPMTGPLAGYDVCVIMRADHPLAARQSVTFADLSDQAWSSFSENFVLGQVLAERCAAHGFVPDLRFRNDNWEVLIPSVVSLGTVCLIPAGFRELTTQHDVAWVPLSDRANHFPIGIATRRGAKVSPVMDEFIQILRRT